jgi:hypothetical protein
LSGHSVDGSLNIGDVVRKVMKLIVASDDYSTEEVGRRTMYAYTLVPDHLT